MTVVLWYCAPGHTTRICPQFENVKPGEPMLEALLHKAQEDAQTLKESLENQTTSVPCQVAFVTSSYDTDFEPLAEQIHTKVTQLDGIYGQQGPVEWSLWLVDDLPSHANFTRRANNAIKSLDPAYQSRVHCVRLRSLPPGPNGRKGRALLDGMEAAWRNLPHLRAVVYVNLNLKVHAALSASALRRILVGNYDAAIGSRHPNDGGQAVGNGTLGLIKSRIFCKLVHICIPPLQPYGDTNAPMKAFSIQTAKLLWQNAHIPNVTMDVEWLAMLHHHRRRLAIVPVVWTQRPGSNPPWHLILPSIVDVVRIRHLWYQTTP